MLGLHARSADGYREVTLSVVFHRPAIVSSQSLSGGTFIPCAATVAGSEVRVHTFIKVFRRHWLAVTASTATTTTLGTTTTFTLAISTPPSAPAPAPPPEGAVGPAELDSKLCFRAGTAAAAAAAATAAAAAAAAAATSSAAPIVDNSHMHYLAVEGALIVVADGFEGVLTADKSDGRGAD